MLIHRVLRKLQTPPEIMRKLPISGEIYNKIFYHIYKNYNIFNERIIPCYNKYNNGGGGGNNNIFFYILLLCTYKKLKDNFD
jgi:hypothetical protein